MSDTQNLQWIDSHAHLNYEYPFSVAEYIENARTQGVTKLITIGAEPGREEQMKKIADQFPNVYFTVGVHPHEAKHFTKDTLKHFDQFVSHPKCVAIGEIGLDYHYMHSSESDQLKVLDEQLEYALLHNKPIVIHNRSGDGRTQPQDAETPQIEALKRFCSKRKSNKSPGVIHCFTGTKKFAEESLKLGFYISFSGIVTFKKADDLRQVLETVPLERILIETDSPFLAPLPFRGKQNQSAYIVETAKVVANIKKVDLATLSKNTVQNTESLFQI